MSRLRANLITNKTANGAPTVQNGLIVTGVATATNVSVAQSVTATTYYGSGANLTGIDATSIKHTNGDIKAQASASGVTITGNLGVSGVLTYEDVTNIDSVGVITARSTVSIADSIIHTGDTNTSLRFPAADTITAETAGLERLRIKSNGYVGIGTENPQRPLAVTSGTSGVTAEFNVPDNAPTGSAGLSLNIVNRSNSGYAPLSFNATLYTFGNSGTERVRIDNNGRLLIGTTTEGASGADQFTVASSSHGGITIRSGSTSNGNLMFSDGTSGAAEYAGYIQYEHDNNKLNIGSNGSTRLSIDSGGQMGLGMTPTRMFEVKDSTGANRVMNIRSTGTSGAYLAFLDANTTDDSKARIGSVGGDDIVVRGDSVQFSSGAGGEYGRFDSSGRLIIGDTTNRLVWGINPHLQVTGTDWDDTCIAIQNFGNNTRRPTLLFTKGKSGTIGNFGTAPAGGEGLGIIGWSAHDTTDAENLACYIQGITEQTATANNQYGAITFSTVNGGTSAYERVRIDKNGDMGVGIAAVPQDSGARTLHVHSTTTGSGARAALRLTHGSTGSAASNGGFLGMDNNPDLYLYNQENGKLRFGTNGSERFLINSYGETVTEESSHGWSTYEMHAKDGGTRFHYRGIGAGSSGTTINLIRVRRHYWGSGWYHIKLRQRYYNGSHEGHWWLHGHGRNTGGHSPSWSLNHNNHNNLGGSKVQITSNSNSSPGNDYSGYVDVYANIGAYEYYEVVIETSLMAGYNHGIANVGNDSYALHPF